MSEENDKTLKAKAKQADPEDERIAGNGGNLTEYRDELIGNLDKQELENESHKPLPDEMITEESKDPTKPVYSETVNGELAHMYKAGKPEDTVAKPNPKFSKKHEEISEEELRKNERVNDKAGR